MGLPNNNNSDLPDVIQSLQVSLEGGAETSEKLKLLSASLPLIGEMAAASGFLALLDICIIFKDCLDKITHADTPLNPQQQDYLCTWPELIKAYTRRPEEATSKSQLIEHLCFSPWGDNIDQSTIEMLKSLLDLPVNNLSATVDNASSSKAKSNQADDLTIETTIDDSVPKSLKELLQLLIEELLSFRKALLKLIAAMNEGLSETATIVKDEKKLARQLNRYADAAEAIGFEGLTKVVKHTHDNILFIAEKNAPFSHQQTESLKTWFFQVLHYLRDPKDPDHMAGLVQSLTDPCWPEGINSEQRNDILSSLQAFGFDAFESTSAAERKIAAEDDISLSFEDDVSADLLEALLAELPGQIEELTAAVQRLSAGGTLEDVTIAKRVAHTLKGAGNTVGVRGIATLTHHLEDILIALTQHETLPTPQISLTLMNATDCLAMMGEFLLGTGNQPENAVAVLQEVLDLSYSIETEGIKTAVPENVIDIKQSRQPGIKSDAQSQAQQGNKPEEEKESQAPVIRVPSDFVDNLLRLVGESIIMTEQIRERVRLTMTQVKNMQPQFDSLRQLGGELEEIIDVKNLSTIQNHDGPESKFDDLEMDQYSELHTCSRRLVEASVDANEMSREVFGNLTRLSEMLIDQAALNNETQEGVMRTRMVPAKAQFSRLQRSVRQAARLTGKDIALHLEGGDTLMDTDTLNNMLDPLMHVLRNAVDHGIEDKSEREKQGKEGKGNIYLAFARDGNNIAVTCRDDGKGLDFDAIRETAIENGLLDKDQAVSEEELKYFILSSSFSTCSETTQISGRGIGMDAVYAKIMALSGSFQIDSVKGKGCTIEIQLPQTLISSYALLIRAGAQMMAIANRGIEQIFHHENGLLRTTENETVFQVGEHAYPVKPVEELLNISSDRREQDRSPRTFILVQTESGKTAISVEKITGSYDFVIKSLGHYIPKLPGILGVTILGNGGVTPVLDLVDLLRQSGSFAGTESQYNRDDEDHQGLPAALVVDDSLSARRSLEQFMQDLGFEVISARDGLEAVEIINTQKPDIVLSDLEMPRMNGMELVSLLRAASETVKLPVIMITSRAARKHKDEALAAGVDVYLTKPYSEDELLEHINHLHPGKF